ncbi:AlpA family phage regulatory protein [Thalassotalea sp. LPB0316]|uniref:helix-turn-helix transcriptional regulator n=1 Tax=Thalassotalea sp. LPB0316 TaxID=2769490 RepID=UPI001866221A|nr:AlpA family phage regulatory protein [Thalassotalea sp. LPB0316]
MEVQTNKEYAPHQLEMFHVLKQSDLMRILQVSRTTLYRMRQNPNFPRQLTSGKHMLGWDSAEFYSWLALQRRAR